MDVRPLTAADREWLVAELRRAWASEISISRGRRVDAGVLPGFVAGDRQGVATYCVRGDECELTTLNGSGGGAGTALVEAVAAEARRQGCRRLWLITTNDNTDALRFYQRRGFRLAALHRDAIAESRRLKPEIPATGLHDIPIRDELELELEL